MSIDLKTPQEVQKKIADQARTKRLKLNLSQKTLSDKSGVSYGVLKKFEQTGQISHLRIAILKIKKLSGILDAEALQ